MEQPNLHDLESQHSSLASELSCWQSLQESAGWKKLMTIAEGQISARSISVLRTRLASMDLALGQEYDKGEAAGIELFSKIPEVQIEVLKHEIELLNQEIENETEVDVAGRSGSGDDSGRDLIDPGDGDASGNDAFGGEDRSLGAP